MTEIHIQLPRQLARAFCGRDLDSGQTTEEGGASEDRGVGKYSSDRSSLVSRRAPSYVTISQARGLLEGGRVEICGVCRMNLRRFDDRMLMGRNEPESQPPMGDEE